MDWILKLLGLGGGSVLNTVTGVVDHLAFLPILVYLVNNSEKAINLGSVNMGTLALIVGAFYVLMEIGRRSNHSLGSSD